MGNGTSALSHILHSAEVIHAGMYVLKQDDMNLSKALVTTVQWSEECAVEGLRKLMSVLESKTALSVYCVLIFFSSGPVLYHTISLLLRGHLPFPSPCEMQCCHSMGVSDFGNQWFCFEPPLLCIFPVLFLLYFMGLNVLILSYCRTGGRKTIQLQEGLWF